MNEKKENLGTVLNRASRKILCRLEGVEESSENNYYKINVSVRPVCEEAEIIEENYLAFDHPDDNSYFINRKYINLPYVDDIPFNDGEEYVSRIKELLTGKLFYVVPSYTTREENEGKYYRRGKIPAQQITTDDVGADYLVIPTLDAANVNLFLSGEYFTVQGWNSQIYGTPKYLFYANTLYAVTLENNPDDPESYRKTEEKYMEYNLGKDMARKYIVYPDPNKSENYFFLSKVYFQEPSLAKSKGEETPSVSEETVIEEEEVPAAIETSHESVAPEKEKSILESFQKFAIQSYLYFDDDDVFNFHTCLKSSFITILAGMSGTGKTKLPSTYARYFRLSEKNQNFLFVPVSPAYTEPSDILGFLNPATGKYVQSETGLVNFLMHANQNREQMHMVIFDEMNLAPIEHYFAPFLSILERDSGSKKIKLYEKNESVTETAVPPEIEVGNNVIFVGTINLDESTRNLSDRLLDRSLVISLKKKGFADAVATKDKNESDVKTEDLYFQGDYYALMKDRKFDDFDFTLALSGRHLEFLDKVHDLLNKADSQKGVSFRSARQMSLYMQNKGLFFDEQTAFDYAFKQSVMTKISGTEDSLKGVLSKDKDKDKEDEKCLFDLFEEYKDISSFNESKAEAKHKLSEIERHGFTR